MNRQNPVSERESHLSIEGVGLTSRSEAAISEVDMIRLRSKID